MPPPTPHGDREQLGPRLAQAGEVPAALERRAEDDVAAGVEVVERRGRVRQARAAGRRCRRRAAGRRRAGRRRPRARPRGRRREPGTRSRPAGRSAATVGTACRRSRIRGDASRRTPGRAPRRRPPKRRRGGGAAACSALRRAAPRTSARPASAAGSPGGPRDDDGGGRHSSWNRYTTPVGASARGVDRGQRRRSSAANASVLAAISSSSRSTGVASACTPLA